MILFVILQKINKTKMKKKIVLFIVIYLILSFVCFISFFLAIGNDEGQYVSNVLLIIATYFYYVFSFPILTIIKLFSLPFTSFFWFIFAALIDILFYTVLIYNFILNRRNKRKVKEE